MGLIHDWLWKNKKKDWMWANEIGKWSLKGMNERVLSRGDILLTIFMALMQGANLNEPELE